nr:MATH and LRR domain-containing protein PFE0570w-like [Halyomorpha halys]
MLAEKRKEELERVSSTNSENFRNDEKSKQCTNGPEIKSSKSCLIKNKIVNDQIVPNVPKNIGNPQIIVNSDNEKLQTELIPSINGNYDTLRNECPAKIENITSESKSKQAKDQSTGTLEDQSTDLSGNKNKDIGQHLSPDTSIKPSEQTKYMKYTPDSPNYICAPQNNIVSCKYKLSRGVHSDKPDISRESKKHLRNAQPDFTLDNEINLDHKTDNSNINNNEATSTNTIKNQSSKIELIKPTIYKFHCHSESLDYKVYKYVSSLTISSETKQSNTIKPNINDMQTGNLEQINISKKREYVKQNENKCFEDQKRQINDENVKLTNINTVRIRIPPIAHLKNAEFTKGKETPTITAEQSANQQSNVIVISKTRENSSSIPNRVHDTKEINSEVSRKMKENDVTHLKEVKDEKNLERKENMNMNLQILHLSNKMSDKEKSNFSDIKTEQTIKQKKEIEDEDGAKYEPVGRANCVNNSKIFLPCVTREKYNPEGYNIDYSRRELKKILPYLKNLPYKKKNIYSKEDTNFESIKNEEQAEKEKKLSTGKETNLTIKSNTHAYSLEIQDGKNFMPFISAIKNKTALNNKCYNPNIFWTTNSKGQSGKDDLKAPDEENAKVDIRKNKELQELQLENQIESNSSTRQQLAAINLQGGITRRKMWNRNIKKHIIFPSFDKKNKIGLNVLYYEDSMNKQKKEKLGVQHPTMITGMEIKQQIMRTYQKPWMDKFHEFLINENILNINKIKKNIFLMHGFNKVSLLKVSEDSHHDVTNIFPKLIPTIDINTNSNKGELSKNKINVLQVLENDLKEMLYQQLEQYNRDNKHKYPEIVKKNKFYKIYDLFDCSFNLQHFNKVSHNCGSLKNVQKKFCQSGTSLSKFEFVNNTTKKTGDKTVPIQVETNKDVSNTIKQIETCGRLIVKENPKDISLIEVLDCRIPMKCTKSTVKESNTDDIGSQNFSLISSKHMCFYSKYRMNCKGQNVIMKPMKEIGDKEMEKKNTSVVPAPNIKQNSVALNKNTCLESIQKSSFQGIPILPLDMKSLTFQEIHDYKHRKNVEIEDEKNKLNESLEWKDREKNKNSTKLNLVKDNPVIVKIEPEVLHYMKKLDIFPLDNDFTTFNDTNSKEKNTKEAFFTTKPFQENSLGSHKPNDFSSNKKKNVSDHNIYEVIKTGNFFIKEISYSTDIKLLDKNAAYVFDVINDSRRGTFEYLTHVIKKHKLGTTNLNSTATTDINEKMEKSDEVFATKKHKDIGYIKHSSPLLVALDSPTLEMAREKDVTKKQSNVITATNTCLSNKASKARNDKNLSCNHINSQMLEASKNDIKMKMINPNVNSANSNNNTEDECKSRIDSNKNKAISAEITGNRVNKSKVIKNLENKLSKIENDMFGDNKIISSSKNLKSNNMPETVNAPIQNELTPLVNMEPMKKRSPHNINYDQRNKTESGSKIKLTTPMNNFKTTENSFRGMCLNNEDLKKSKDKVKTSTHIQNFSQSNRARNIKYLDSDNSKISNNLGKAVCKINTVLNKKYASMVQKDTSKEMQSTILLMRNEAKNTTKTLNPQKGSRNLDKLTEKDIINEVSVEEQKEVKKVNIIDVMKPITTDNKDKDHINNKVAKVDENVIEDSKLVKNEQNDIKTDNNKAININDSNKSYITESIPTGLRCIRQQKIEADKEKGKERCYLQKPPCPPDQIKLEREGKHIKSPIRKDKSSIREGKSVTSAKPTLIGDSGTNVRLNQYLMKHKKQLEAITNDKRVKSIKNKLSNNLKTKDDSKIINKQSHTLMSYKNEESSKKKSEDNKRDTRKEREDRLHSQKNSIKSFPDGKKPSFNAINLENNFKPIYEYKDDRTSKAENTEQNFIQQEANVRKVKNRETNSIHSTVSFHSFKKNIKTNQKNKCRENPIYILKVQPKAEGFISQSLRSSNSGKRSSEVCTATTKKRQSGHLMKQRVKSELKQSNTNLKKKKSKHRTQKTDLRIKNDQKKNQNNLKVAQSSKIFSQKELPLHVFQKEQKKFHKNYSLDTPSRQVCGLTPPRIKPKEICLMPKEKVITKLIACTQQKGDVHKQSCKVEKNVKNYREVNVNLTNGINNKKPEKECVSTSTKVCCTEEGDKGVKNPSKYQFDKLEAGELKDESQDQNTNQVGTKDLKSDIKLTIDENKHATELSTKVSNGNDVSNCQLITNSKDNIDLPSLVGNVVNNVKARIQNFLLADIAKLKLNEGIMPKKKRQQEINDLKSSITKLPEHISREENGLTKLNKNTKPIVFSTLASYANGTSDQDQSNKMIDKEKEKPISNSRDTSQSGKTISDILRFKPIRNEQTCPQMSYSEVLNKFYTGC